MPQQFPDHHVPRGTQIHSSKIINSLYLSVILAKGGTTATTIVCTNFLCPLLGLLFHNVHFPFPWLSSYANTDRITKQRTSSATIRTMEKQIRQNQTPHAQDSLGETNVEMTPASEYGRLHTPVVKLVAKKISSIRIHTTISSHF